MTRTFHFLDQQGDGRDVAIGRISQAGNALAVHVALGEVEEEVQHPRPRGVGELARLSGGLGEALERGEEGEEVFGMVWHDLARGLYGTARTNAERAMQ
ncbi:hypothetical protein [Muricoccus nepalensis]|uniref:hypothetical protein n=1 Tax=Muricoccus nepalensis TaxID=1854500 RepID=UPI001F501FC3|nr:hypothetical protein [Roseomonas nepalensis]